MPTVELTKDTFEETIVNNDIVLVEPGVSRNHCRIYRQLGVYFFEDLKSANGSRLNGEILEQEEALRDGDLPEAIDRQAEAGHLPACPAQRLIELLVGVVSFVLHKGGKCHHCQIVGIHNGVDVPGETK